MPLWLIYEASTSTILSKFDTTAFIGPYIHVLQIRYYREKNVWACYKCSHKGYNNNRGVCILRQLHVKCTVTHNKQKCAYLTTVLTQLIHGGVFHLKNATTRFKYLAQNNDTFTNLLTHYRPIHMIFHRISLPSPLAAYRFPTIFRFCVTYTDWYIYLCYFYQKPFRQSEWKII